ncbi:MAG: hypothetical protein Fur0040_11000 [Sideroxydans sp.]
MDFLAWIGGVSQGFHADTEADGRLHRKRFRCGRFIGAGDRGQGAAGKDDKQASDFHEIVP